VTVLLARFAILLGLLLAIAPAAAQAPQSFQYQNITTETTTVVKSTPGVLHSICVNTPAATGTITIYDNTAGSGTKIGTITSYASLPKCFTYDVAFWTGLTIVTATAAPDVTVSWR
jgi:ABC-type arginine transport system permease subunit